MRLIWVFRTVFVTGTLEHWNLIMIISQPDIDRRPLCLPAGLPEVKFLWD